MDRNQLMEYFTRIGLSYADYENRPRDRKMLSELHQAHRLTVPFETLDMVRGVRISLEPEALYEKIVRRHRGGNCFETNGLSADFLRALGFGVRECFSRYFRDSELEVPFRRHRLLIVETLDGPCFWDIGIGHRSPLFALRLIEGVVQEDCGEQYRFTKEPFFGWMLWDFYSGEWTRVLSFTEEPQHWVDFITACVWCEFAPESPFHQFDIVSVRTLEGRKTMDGDVFRHFRGDQVEERPGLTEQEKTVVLREEFGIVL